MLAGECCRTPLLSDKTCCKSGVKDGCGVCDGNGSGCKLKWKATATMAETCTDLKVLNGVVSSDKCSGFCVKLLAALKDSDQYKCNVDVAISSQPRRRLLATAIEFSLETPGTVILDTLRQDLSAASALVGTLPC